MYSAFKNVILTQYAEFIRFCVVGLCNTAVNYSIYLYLLYHHVNYLLAGVVGYLVAATVGFLLNRRWTFRVKVPLTYLVVYLLINVISIGATVLIQWIVVELMHVPKEFSLLFAIAFTTFLNYFLIRSLIFKRPLFN
jgi:putative flippase GtrA